MHAALALTASTTATAHREPRSSATYHDFLARVLLDTQRLKPKSFCDLVGTTKVLPFPVLLEAYSACQHHLPQGDAAIVRRDALMGEYCESFRLKQRRGPLY